MKHHPCHVIAFLTVCQLSLAACSSGGATASGVAALPPSPSVSTPAAPQTIPLPTVLVPANFQPANITKTYPATSAVAGPSSTGLILPSPAEGLITATVTTDGLGNFGRIAFAFPDVTGKTVTANVNLTFAGPQLAQLASMLQQVYGPFQDDGAGLVLFQSAGAQSLTSSAFGVWAVSYENDPSGNGAGRAYAFAFGDPTPCAAMPATGSATFNGTTTGLGGGGGANSLYALQGNAQITANFSTQSVSSKFTNLTTQNIYTNAPGSLPDLNGTSTIAGNAYAGTIAGGALTGTIKGGFYGSAAQETAGTWSASGGGTSWAGSYGAK